MNKFLSLLFLSVLLIGCTKNVAEEKPVSQPPKSENPAPSTDDGVDQSGDSSDDDLKESKGVTKVQIYLIGIDDNGTSGKKVGANDSAIPVMVDIEPTKAPLKAALNKLISLDEQMYGQSGFYHALYQSDLEIKSVIVDDGEAVIELTGKLMIGGALDNPRVKAQIEETALQFDSVNRVSIFINGKRLDDVLSLQ